MSTEHREGARRRKRRTQGERRDEADQRMTEAAIQLISERGFMGLTLGEVGARSGYSATLPLHYYKTKEALILLTAKRIIEDYSQSLATEVEGQKGLSAIRTFARTYLMYASASPEKRRALFMITSEAAVASTLRDDVAALARSAAASLAGHIRDGQAAGEIEAMVDPDALGVLILSQLRGAISLWAVDPLIDLDRLGTAIEGSLLRTLLAHNTKN